MAISPPSDIVLDVTRAANPLRQQVAFERLSRMSAPGTGGTEFASLVDDTTTTTGSVEKTPGLAGAREKLAALHPPRTDGGVWIVWRPRPAPPRARPTRRCASSRRRSCPPSLSR